MECPPLVAGPYISFVVREDGIVLSAGNSSLVGRKTEPKVFAPIETEGEIEIRFPRWISCSGKCSSIVDSEGNLWRHGIDSEGVLWRAGKYESSVFKKVDGVPPLVFSFQSDNYSLSLDEQGQLWNDCTSLGNITQRKEPLLVEFSKPIAKVFDLKQMVIVEDESGKLFQNSIGSAHHSPLEFEEVDIGSRFLGAKTLGGSNQVSTILDIEGKIWTRGRSSTYLGRNDDSLPANEFHEIGLERITSLGAGEFNSIASDEAGHLWVWGAGNQWQLGNGGKIDEKIPKRLDEFAFVKHVASGRFHGIVSDIEGNLWVFGWNLHGELGFGDKTERIRPTLVPGISVHHGNRRNHCKKPNY